MAPLCKVALAENASAIALEALTSEILAKMGHNEQSRLKQGMSDRGQIMPDQYVASTRALAFLDKAPQEIGKLVFRVL